MWAVGDMGVGDVDGLGLPVVRRCGQSGDVDARGCGRSGDVGVRECGRLGDVGGQGCVGGYGCQEVQAVGAAGGQGMRAVLGDVGSWGLPAVGGCRQSGCGQLGCKQSGMGSSRVASCQGAGGSQSCPRQVPLLSIHLHGRGKSAQEVPHEQ